MQKQKRPLRGCLQPPKGVFLFLYGECRKASARSAGAAWHKAKAGRHEAGGIARSARAAWRKAKAPLFVV